MSEFPPIVVEPRLALCEKHGRSIPWPEGFPPLGMWLLMQMLAADEVAEMVPGKVGEKQIELAMPVLREFSPWCEQPFIDQKEFRRLHELSKTDEGRQVIYKVLAVQQEELRAERFAQSQGDEGGTE